MENPLSGPSLDETLWNIDKKENENEMDSKSKEKEPVDLRVTTDNKMMTKSAKNEEPKEPEDEREDDHGMDPKDTVPAKGIFDDMVGDDDDAEDTIFGDKPGLFDTETPKKPKQQKATPCPAPKDPENAESVKVTEDPLASSKEDAMSPLPSLSVSEEVLIAAKDDDEDQLEETKPRKKKNSGFFGNIDDLTDIFGEEEEEEDGEDIFGFNKQSKAKKDNLSKKKTAKSSLFDSDDDDDAELFAIEKEADALLAGKGTKNEEDDTINID